MRRRVVRSSGSLLLIVIIPAFVPDEAGVNLTEIVICEPAGTFELFNTANWLLLDVMLEIRSVASPVLLIWNCFVSDCPTSTSPKFILVVVTSMSGVAVLKALPFNSIKTTDS